MWWDASKFLKMLARCYIWCHPVGDPLKLAISKKKFEKRVWWVLHWKVAPERKSSWPSQSNRPPELSHHSLEHRACTMSFSRGKYLLQVAPKRWALELGCESDNGQRARDVKSSIKTLQCPGRSLASDGLSGEGCMLLNTLATSFQEHPRYGTSLNYFKGWTSSGR
jgi:hypothetical protein